VANNCDKSFPGKQSTVTKATHHAQWRWRWDLNPRKGCPFTRFRVLRTTVHHRPPAFLTSANRRPAVAGERLRTGVNETKTEPGGWAVAAARMLGAVRCAPRPVPGTESTIVSADRQALPTSSRHEQSPGTS
jgi:hypothetical protein